MDDSIQRLLGVHHTRSPHDTAPRPAPLARVFAHPYTPPGGDAPALPPMPESPAIRAACMGDKILIASG